MHISSPCACWRISNILPTLVSLQRDYDQLNKSSNLGLIGLVENDTSDLIVSSISYLLN